MSPSLSSSTPLPHTSYGSSSPDEIDLGFFFPSATLRGQGRCFPSPAQSPASSATGGLRPSASHSGLLPTPTPPPLLHLDPCSLQGRDNSVVDIGHVAVGRRSWCHCRLRCGSSSVDCSVCLSSLLLSVLGSLYLFCAAPGQLKHWSTISVLLGFASACQSF